MKKILLIIFIVSSYSAQTIDSNNSYVSFNVRNMGVRNVNGTINGMLGTVKFDLENSDSSYFDVTIDVNTINTENTKRDAHLRNSDFFETDKWPTINFKSKKIVIQDELFGVVGNLTIKDVVREVFIPFQAVETDSTIKFIGGDIINRLDYNVGVGTDTFKVANEISIEVTCTVKKNKL